MTQLRGESLAKAFIALCKQNGLPEVHREVLVDWVIGRRRWRFDFAFYRSEKFWLNACICEKTVAMVAVEVEGGAFTRGRHTRGVGFLNDMEKYNRAAVLGWKVLRYPPSKLLSAATVDDIQRALRWDAPDAELTHIPRPGNALA